MNAYDRTYRNLEQGYREFYVATKTEYQEAEAAIRDYGFYPVFKYRRSKGALNRYAVAAIDPKVPLDHWHQQQDGYVEVTFIRLRQATRTVDQCEFKGGDVVMTTKVYTRRVMRRIRRRFRISRGMHLVTVREVIASLALEILRTKRPETKGEDGDGKWVEQWYYENVTIKED